MFSTSLILSALTLALSAGAAVTPTAPSAGQSYNVGAPCPYQYNLDTTGTWKNMTVDLMTGSNFGMVLVVNVATGVDGTTGTGRGTWTCPNVSPNSAIYFYQFTNNGLNNPTWTTRFTIASSTGASTPPSNANQPGAAANATAIPWGTGQLLSASNTTTTPSNTSSAAVVTPVATTSAITTSASMVTVVANTSTSTSVASSGTVAAAQSTTTVAKSGAGQMAVGGGALGLMVLALVL